MPRISYSIPQITLAKKVIVIFQMRANSYLLDAGSNGKLMMHIVAQTGVNASMHKKRIIERK
jgi:hypothetical protein